MLVVGEKIMVCDRDCWWVVVNKVMNPEIA
jgi:hypothetical protein